MEVKDASKPSFVRRALRLTGKVFKWGTVSVVALLAAVALYARVLHRRDAERWHAPGRLVEVEPGRRLHLYCTGAGTPTVVLEAGLGDFSLSSWHTVQPRISAFTRVCSYDRAGTGWSDPPNVAPMPTSMVDDLHAVLAKAGEPGPYLLTGHSLGGPIVRHYAVHYPAEVAGLVLVDGSHEDQLERLKGMPRWIDLVFKALPAIHFLGIDRVAAGMGAADTMSAIAAAMTTSDQAANNTLRLSLALKPFLADVRSDARDFGDLWLTALSAGKMSVPGKTPAGADSLHREWVAMHKEIVARSTRGIWILADKSGHYIQKDQPELVIGAVRAMVDSIRAAGRVPAPSSP